ncbi:MAG: glycosyltransferase family 87 protein [Sediminibacterium sp.]
MLTNNRVPVLTVIWFLFPMLACIAEISRGLGDINNYLIYKQVFWHTIEQRHLYLSYPQEYADVNHYGPLFSVLIAPFALMPVFVGCFFWCLLNVAILFYAIKKLPVTILQQRWILLIAVFELITSIHSVQFNPMLCGMILLSFTALEKEDVALSTFLIVAGTLIKIYSVVGLLFFLFTPHKKKFILYCAGWFVVLFCLPMLLSSPSFIIESYKNWLAVIVEKNGQNIVSSMNAGMQDISVMGMIRRIFGAYQMPNIYVTLPAGILMLLPLGRVDFWKNQAYRLHYLALLLLGLVIFSSSAESPTYVIAVVGYLIWHVQQPNNNTLGFKMLMALVLLLTIFSPTDLFPRFIREQYVLRYSLKALPCFIAWLAVVYTLFYSQFNKQTA